MPVFSPSAPDPFTIPQAARRLGLSEFTVRRYVKDGRLPATRAGFANGVYLIDAAAVETLEREHTASRQDVGA